jgi:hypothetical protein
MLPATAEGVCAEVSVKRLVSHSAPVSYFQRFEWLIEDGKEGLAIR